MGKVIKVKNYMNNPNLPSKGAEYEYTPEMLKEIEKCKDSLLHFAENYFYILNLDEGRQKIKLYPAQKRILRGLRDNRFFCLTASRQIGKSTIATIFILWLANFFPDQKILLVANKESTAMEIFQRVRMSYEMLPNWLKSPIDGEYGKTSMVLENGSKISITTTTGTAGRGSAVSFLVIDEAAWIEAHLLDPFWASVFPIISSSKKAKVFMCSTPNGTGNLFHKIYTESVEGKNNWGSDKILWNDVPGRNQKWADEIRNGLGSDEKWRVEFECCFLNAGTSSMDENHYKDLLAGIKAPVEVLMDGKYTIWEHPSPDRIYAAGVDTAEGVGGDYSCIKILDITDLNDIIEVAEYYNNMIPVSEFANVCFDILSHWGKPIVCIERNNQGGQIADRLGIDYAYEKLVCWGGKLGNRKSQQLLGMISHRNTKYYACANARYYYSDRKAVRFNNEFSIEELFKDFVKVNDTWQAVSGKHDDRTMALIWALMVLDKEICEQYFTIEDTDSCGKPSVISPLDHGVKLFENPTSIYTNEQVERIENSNLLPVAFGGSSEQSDEISGYLAEGWTFLDGRSPNTDSQDYNTDFDKYFG